MAGGDDIAQSASLTAFIARKAEIDDAIARIQSASDNHFFVAAEDVSWGHVSALADHAVALKRITDVLYSEGEHKPWPLEAPAIGQPPSA